jgi:hypothetical protein
MPLTPHADSWAALARLRCSVLRVRVVYLKLRCRSDHRQGRSAAHGRKCVCTISPQRPQTAQHSCPLTSRPRSLPNPAAVSVKVLLLSPTVSELCVTNLTLCLVLPKPRSICYHWCESLHAQGFIPQHLASQPPHHYHNNHQPLESASDSPDSLLILHRHHGQCYCIHTTVPVELRKTHHKDPH